MAQVKVYGLKQNLADNKATLSEIIHGSLVKELGLPSEKKFQRFIQMDSEDFVFPSDRTSAYTIIEISMFEGRLKLHPNDLEITVFQSPTYCWGIRGKTGDELALSYRVNV